jgi:hypothetical protein
VEKVMDKIFDHINNQNKRKKGRRKKKIQKIKKKKPKNTFSQINFLLELIIVQQSKMTQ